jgi:hypothetical protein
MAIQPLTSRATALHSSRRLRAGRPLTIQTVGQCFEVEASRDVSGWQIRIPEIDGVTHASRRATVELAARKCIATRTGIPIGYVSVLVSD